MNEQDRIDEFEAEARAAGREVLTTAAAAHLYDRTVEAIRQPVRAGKIAPALTLRVGAQPAELLRLTDVADRWGTPDADKLTRLRDDGTTLAVRGVGYFVLHTRPIV